MTTQLYTNTLYELDGNGEMVILEAVTAAVDVDLQFQKTVDINTAFGTATGDSIELEWDNDGQDITTGGTQGACTAINALIKSALAGCDLEYYATARGTRFTEADYSNSAVPTNAKRNTGDDAVGAPDGAGDLTNAGTADFGDVDAATRGHTVDEPDIMSAAAGYCFFSTLIGGPWTAATRQGLNTDGDNGDGCVFSDEVSATPVVAASGGTGNGLFNGVGNSSKWVTKLMMDAYAADKTTWVAGANPGSGDGKHTLNLSAGDSIYIHFKLDFSSKTVSDLAKANTISAGVNDVIVSLRLQQSS